MLGAGLPTPPQNAPFSPSFYADLKTIYLAETEKDPDDLVHFLAQLFDAREIKIHNSRKSFLADLREVYEAEGGKDPEDDLDAVAALGRRSSALVFQALRHLGQPAVDERVIARLRRVLSAQQKKQLLRDARYTTDWIADVVRRVAQVSYSG